MRTFLLLSLLLMCVSPSLSQDAAAADSDEGSLVKVLGFKWTRSRHVPKKPEAGSNTPGAPIVTPDIKIWHRPENNQQPQQVIRDPKADTVEGRSAALEKIVQEARSPKAKTVESFTYQVKLRNASPRVIEIVFWEYQFKELSNPKNVVRRQFLCGVNIKPDKEKELTAFSMSGPSNVVSVDSLANKSGNLFDEKVVINRVEYSDGSILQRKDWNFAEVKLSIERAVKTPWGPEMCRGL
jgi:hypothetical protein